MKKRIVGPLIFVLAILLVSSCSLDNVFISPEVTPEGKKAVANIVSSIEAVEPVTIELTPYEYVYGLLSTAFNELKVDISDADVEKLMDEFFPNLKDKNIKFSYSYVAPASWSVISDILSLTTREDIAYMNSCLSLSANKDAAYGKALDDFFNLVLYLAGDDVTVANGLFSVKDEQELDLSDFISVQIAFRFIFINSFNAVAASYDAYVKENPEAGIAGYMENFDIKSILRQFLSKDIMDEVLNYYTVLYRLSPSTSIVKISALSDLFEEGS